MAVAEAPPVVWPKHAPRWVRLMSTLGCSPAGSASVCSVAPAIRGPCGDCGLGKPAFLFNPLRELHNCWSQAPSPLEITAKVVRGFFTTKGNHNFCSVPLEEGPGVRVGGADLHVHAAVGAGQLLVPSNVSSRSMHWRSRGLVSTALQRILVCGWGEPTFMSNLLRELDHGPAALPLGSEVVMVNRLESEQQSAMLKVFPVALISFRVCLVPPRSESGWRRSEEGSAGDMPSASCRHFGSTEKLS